jgi:hypothetical protein
MFCRRWQRHRSTRGARRRHQAAQIGDQIDRLVKRRIAHVSGGDTPLFAAHQRTPEEQKAWDEM